MERQQASSEFERLQNLNDFLEREIYRMMKLLDTLGPGAQRNIVLTEMRQAQVALDRVRRDMDELHFHYYGVYEKEM